MGATTPLFYNNEKHYKTQPRCMKFMFKITAAKTVTPVPVGADCLTLFDAPASQAVIDSYLSSPEKTVANDFLLAAFDATAMGADAFAGIINMNGQARSAVGLVARCYSGTGGATLVQRAVAAQTALTASTLETAVAASAGGNLAFKIDFGNTPDFDALTAGLIEVEIYWIAR